MKLKRGNFIWENGIKDSKAIFVLDPNGKFIVYAQKEEKRPNS